MKLLCYSLILYLLLTSGFAASKSIAVEGEFSFARERRSVTIPIRVTNNLAVMPLYINESGPFYFILDSGVNTTILTEPVIAQILGLNLRSTVLIYGLGGEGIVEAALATGVNISTRGIIGKNMNLLVIPEDILSFSEVFGFPVYGIIGHDFLRQFPVRIDYANETIRVFREPTYRRRNRDIEVPIRIVNGKPYVESTIVSEKGDSLTTNLLFDLGASHPIYLNNDYIELSEEVIDGFLGKGISGNLLGRLGRVEKVIIGNTHIENPVVSYPERRFLEFHGQEIDWEGLIGGGIIRRYNVILDYKSEKLILRPGRDHNKPFNTSLSGLEVVARGPDMRQFIVHYVRPGSAGYEAGVMTGDQIVRLNMLRYTQLTLDQILDILSSGERKNISMTVIRDGELMHKDFRLREDI